LCATWKRTGYLAEKTHKEKPGCEAVALFVQWAKDNLALFLLVYPVDKNNIEKYLVIQGCWPDGCRCPGSI